MYFAHSYIVKNKSLLHDEMAIVKEHASLKEYMFHDHKKEYVLYLLQISMNTMMQPIVLFTSQYAIHGLNISIFKGLTNLELYSNDSIFDERTLKI